MAGEMVSPHFLAFIRSLKPYLGPRGLQCTELAETLLELLSSEQAQKAQNTFRALRQERQRLSALKGDKKEEGNRPRGRDPFTLFLILILLLLSSDTNCKKKR